MTGRRKTHCKHGHKFTAKNTKWRHLGGYDIQVCRRCIALAEKIKYQTDPVFKAKKIANARRRYETVIRGSNSKNI